MKFILASIALLLTATASAGIPFSNDVTFGVNYSVFFSGLKPYPAENYVLDFNNLKNCEYFKDQNVAIKLFNTLSLEPVITNTNKEVFLGIDNVDLAKIAGSLDEARKWVDTNAKYMVQTTKDGQVQRVKAINVGNEIFAAAAWDESIYQNTAAAMQNIVDALKEKNLSHIKVTTTTCCALNANPAREEDQIPSLTYSGSNKPKYVIPSNFTGGYEPPFIEVKPKFKEEFKKILKIIAANDSFLSINLYPPFAIQGLNDNPDVPRDVVNMVIDSGLFKSKDPKTGNYLVEDMIKGYDFAIKKLNVEDSSVPAYVDYVISEIGWPRHVYSPTDSNNYVSIEKSKAFYQGLKTWAKNYVRKLDPFIDPAQSYSQKMPIFIFSFRDEQNKQNIFEPYWGIYTDEASPRDEMGLCTK